MLVPKLKMNDVVTIKLTTGEELIGYFVSEDDNKIEIRKPLVPVPAGDNQMILAPFLMSVDMNTSETYPIHKSTVITRTKTGKQFADVYTKQTSGIDMSASSSGLIR